MNYIMKLFKYQSTSADFYNIPIGNIKKLLSNFFDKEKYVLHYKNLQLYLKPGLKLKKINCVLELNLSQWLKPFVKINTQQLIEAEKNEHKDGKELYKLTNSACMP